MKKKQPAPIVTDPFGSYTGVVRFPDAMNPNRDATPVFPKEIDPAGAARPLTYPISVNPRQSSRPLRFPQAENPVQDADDL